MFSEILIEKQYFYVFLNFVNYLESVVCYSRIYWTLTILSRLLNLCVLYFVVSPRSKTSKLPSGAAKALQQSSTIYTTEAG